MTKSILAAVMAISLGASTALAEHHEEGKDFPARKAEISKEIDEHIKALQDHKSCVSAAQDPAAMKACREKMKEYRHGQMMERMGDKKERLEKRMEKMKEKKK